MMRSQQQSDFVFQSAGAGIGAGSKLFCLLLTAVCMVGLAMLLGFVYCGTMQCIMSAGAVRRTHRHSSPTSLPASRPVGQSALSVAAACKRAKLPRSCSR